MKKILYRIAWKYKNSSLSGHGNWREDKKTIESQIERAKIWFGHIINYWIETNETNL